MQNEEQNNVQTGVNITDEEVISTENISDNQVDVIEDINPSVQNQIPSNETGNEFVQSNMQDNNFNNVNNGDINIKDDDISEKDNTKNSSTDQNASAVNTTVSEENIDELVKEDKKGLWWVLGFLIPLLGVILFFCWKNKTPKRAKSCLIGALINICISIVLGIAVTKISYTQVSSTVDKAKLGSFISTYKMVRREVETAVKISDVASSTITCDNNDVDYSKRCSTIYSVSDEDYYIKITSDGSDGYNIVFAVSGIENYSVSQNGTIIEYGPGNKKNPILSGKFKDIDLTTNCPTNSCSKHVIKENIK